MPPQEYLYLDEKRKRKLVANIRRKIDKFALKPQQLGLVTN